MNRQYGMEERMAMSDGVSANADVESVLMANVPGACAVRRAAQRNDKRGTDWWVEHVRGDHLSIDAKVRSEDFSKKTGEDDLALETWSVIDARTNEGKKVGWTRDPEKRCDYILWLWKDTGRWCLVPFPMLCAVFQEQWQPWLSQFKNRTQETTDFAGRVRWKSQCVYVPRREIWKAIYDKFSGRLIEQ
jgi:hypothetical protein